MRAIAAVLAGLLLTACSPGGTSSDDPDAGQQRPSSATPDRPNKPKKTRTPSKPITPKPTPTQPPLAYSNWVVGAQPLPLRSDGLGVMGETPKTLQQRLLPTRDLLPPPTDGKFHSNIAPISAAIRQRMGESWSPECPVGLEDLRYVNVTFRGYDQRAHTGEVVVAASEAAGIVSVFKELYAADFPIEEMRLVGTADLEAEPTGDGNNTAALVCRPTTGSTTTWSAHAYGLAIDVNPFVNPYEKGDVILPELARSYLDRSWVRPGMAEPDSMIVRAFARIGWSWGGAWSSLKDYQHFTATGR